jgi:ankyrin repeat protein
MARYFQSAANERSQDVCYAAQHGDVERVGRLLGRGASVDSPDEAGVAPLMEAARAGRLHVCEQLLHHGGDVNASAHA